MKKIPVILTSFILITAAFFGCAAPQPAAALSAPAGLYCWHLFLFNEECYPEFRPFLQEQNIDRVYQSLPERYLQETDTAAMVMRLAADGIETVALTGNAEWGLADNDLGEIKAYIDALSSYNSGIGIHAPIRKLALDVETHTLPEWREDPRTAFSAYIEKMQEVYTYAHLHGISVVQVIPIHLDTIDESLLRLFFSTCCDEVSLMNYTRATQESAPKAEIEICRELGIPVESIFETMPPSETHKVTDRNTYFHVGLDALREKQDRLARIYDYENFSFAYHYFLPLYHLSTGNYLAEIYAYTDELDPNRDELGQTDQLKTIQLTGDDGSVITAGLYNPNLGYEYEESSYLAVGVQPDVTYTVSAVQADYRILTPELTFSFADEDNKLIDYTSIHIERISAD